MSSNGDVSRSPFLSLFHRKKKVNGTKSADDLKLLANGQKSAAVSNSPHQVDPKMTRTDSKKKDKKANTLPSSDRKKSKKSQKGFNDYTKSQSMDVLCEEDPSILVEALQAIADEQPIVARSIPKHAKIIEKDHNTQLKNCIFEPEVYDSMLSDSLKVCDMLQSHLDQCIISVRSKSPEAMSPVAIRRNNGSAQIASNGVAHASYSTPTVRRFPLKSCVQADV